MVRRASFKTSLHWATAGFRRMNCMKVLTLHTLRTRQTSAAFAILPNASQELRGVAFETGSPKSVRGYAADLMATMRASRVLAKVRFLKVILEPIMISHTSLTKVPIASPAADLVLQIYKRTAVGYVVVVAVAIALGSAVVEMDNVD